MKRVYSLLLLFSLFPCLVMAQEADYYKAIANSDAAPAKKLEAMDSVISMSFRKDDALFVDYSLRYIDLAIEMDSISLAAKKAMNLQYIITTRQNNPKQAVAVINSVLRHKHKINDSFLLGGLYLKRGGAHFRVDIKEAIEDYTLALEHFSEKDSIYKADAYLFRGQAYSNLGKFVPAGESYQNAYNYYEALKDYEYMVHSQQGITTMFSMNGFYDKAKAEREKIISKLKALELNNYLAVEYYNQALDYKKLGNKELHLEYLLKAASTLEKFPDEEKDYIKLIYVHAKLAEHYAAENETGKAAKKIELLNEWIKKTSDLSSELSYHSALARHHYALGDYNTALLHAQKKLEGALSYNYMDAILEAYNLLADIYAKKEDFKQSLQNKETYITLKDSMYNTGTANSLAYYQTLYETEKKEKELVAKNSNIQLLEKDNEAFKKLFFFVSVALLLIFLLVLLFRNQVHLRNKKRLQEKFSQELLVSQEAERLRISKDLHDGLGQRLLLIKNKLLASGDRDTKSMVDDTIEEVRTISRDLHPFQLQEMGITKAIEHTLTQIDENTTLFISSEIDNIDNIFTREQEVNIYRIIQESLNNIIKHAQAEASKVSIRRAANAIHISIKDNGIGFDFSEKLHAVKSLGLKTLLERTRFLNGQMKIHSKQHNGTTIEFQFPIS